MKRRTFFPALASLFGVALGREARAGQGEGIAVTAQGNTPARVDDTVALFKAKMIRWDDTGVALFRATYTVDDISDRLRANGVIEFPPPPDINKV